MNSLALLLAVPLLLSTVGSRESIPQGSVMPRVAQTDQVMAELIAAEVPGVQGRELWVGIHFKLASGWHIYWKNPGDSGSAPTVSWTVSPHTRVVGPINWPTPSRLPLGPLMNYGYEGDVVLPARMLWTGRSHPALAVSANLHWVVCSTQCIPGRAQLAISIRPFGATSGLPPEWARLIAASRNQLPQPMPEGWRTRATFAAQTFTLSVTMNGPATHAVFFPLDESEIDDSSPQVVETRGSELRIRLRQSAQMARPPRRLRGVLVFDSKASFNVDTGITPDRPLPQSPRRSQ